MAPEYRKPRVGIVRDPGQVPRWTKYRRFLETNGFPFDHYDIGSGDWIEKARAFDVVINIVSNEISHLEEIQVKYYFLEYPHGHPSATRTRPSCFYHGIKGPRQHLDRLRPALRQKPMCPIAGRMPWPCSDGAGTLSVGESNRSSGSMGVSHGDHPAAAAWSGRLLPFGPQRYVP